MIIDQLFAQPIFESQTDPITQFASNAHEEWRRNFDPTGTKPRIKKNSDGTEGDINVPFEKLHPDWKKENLAAGHAAHHAVKHFGRDMEKAAEHVHNEWMKRNPKADYNAAQHVPYDDLSDDEKEKDRVHVRTMMRLMGHQPKQGIEEAGNANSGRCGPNSATDNTPVKHGRVEKIKSGIKHHADPSRYGGSEPEVDDDQLLGYQSRYRLHKAVTPDEVDEVAPPGAKAERMVKHIKQGYAKDGKLTPKEKGIAFATAWKAHNAGRVEEGEYQDDYEDEETELCNGCYVRDKEDSSGEIFVMRGDPGDRRVRIEDRHGRGWNIAPYRLTVVDDSDPDIAAYFGDELDEAGVTEAAQGHTIEAHGVRGMDRRTWHKTFRNTDQMIAWAEKHDAEIIGTRDLEQARQGVSGGLMNKIANKVMGAAPEQPKYKVGQRVKYETSPHQPDWKDGGRGVGVITAYKNGHYMINGNPVNHFEIKGVVEQGVAEGSEQKPTITYKDYTLQYDYQTEDDDPEGYSTATTYYFDVLKDGDRVGEAEYFDYFGNLTIRINGKTKEFGFRHPLASQISQLVSSLPDEQKKDLSDPKFESQGVEEGYQDDSKEREENLRYSRSRNPVADAIRKKLNPNQKEQNKEKGVTEGYTGRETKAGTWRVFKDGNSVAVAGPFKSADEAAAWIKKHKQGITEMDKSEPSAGRDTGPRPGPDREAKPIAAKKATRDAGRMLNRAFQDSHKKKDVKEGEIEQTKTGIRHRGDRYGSGEELPNGGGNRSGFPNPGKYARDLDNLDKGLTSKLDHSMGVSWPKGRKKQDMDENINPLMLKLKRALIKEGRVKELADDLKTMSDADFMKKYGKAKAAIRKDMKQLDEAPVNELSTNKLAQYKTAAAKDATAADKAGDFKRGDKRLSGMVQATKKQFDNDAKKVDESRAARRALMAQIVNGN